MHFFLKVICSSLLVFIGIASTKLGAEDYTGPIIDVHLHSYDQASYWGGRTHYSGASSPKTAEEHRKATIEQMNKNKVVYAVVSGTSLSTATFTATDKRFIPGYSYNNDLPALSDFEAKLKAGEIKVFGELGTVYYGENLTHPKFDPYLALCEKYNVPVAYHTGGGPSDIHKARPDFRLIQGNPLLIEPILVKYPKLKIYLMHSGEVYYEEAVRLMVQYSNVYSDLGVLLWVNPLPKSYAVDFLKRAKVAGVLDRVMFGSDQMVWPEAISRSVDYLNSLDFLTKEEKANIFFYNAKEFFSL